MKVFGLILTYDLSNTAMLFVFVCFTRLLFLAMTKYVTKSPMKIMMTRHLELEEETATHVTLQKQHQRSLIPTFTSHSL